MVNAWYTNQMPIISISLPSIASSCGVSFCWLKPPNCIALAKASRSAFISTIALMLLGYY
jgi:hypothetical protein